MADPLTDSLGVTQLAKPTGNGGTHRAFCRPCDWETSSMLGEVARILLALHVATLDHEATIAAEVTPDPTSSDEGQR